MLPQGHYEGSGQRFALRGAGGWRHLWGVSKPIPSPRAGAAVVQTPLWHWHRFTFPSDRVAGSAAQFNSSVSIAPPTRSYSQINGCRRRHDGYTAKG